MDEEKNQKKVTKNLQS